MKGPDNVSPRWGWGFVGDVVGYKHVAPLALAAVRLPGRRQGRTAALIDRPFFFNFNPVTILE